LHAWVAIIVSPRVYKLVLAIRPPYFCHECLPQLEDAPEIHKRQTFIDWVNQSRRFSPWAQAFYVQQKQAGKTHQKAIRALAYKWGRILWRCWQDNTPYDEQKSLTALIRKKSSLIKLLGGQELDSQTLQQA
jgi:hypothetical protein